MAKLHPLEHKTIQLLKLYQLNEQVIVVACSGGLDSMALLVCLNNISRVLSLKLSVVHIHHGEGSNEGFRGLAAEFVQDQCKKMNLDLQMFRAESAIGHSEADLRNYREKCFEEVKVNESAPLWLAFGHHAEDLLETQLLQMMRGCGPAGFLSMRVKSEWKIRPFLEISREDIRQYAKEMKIKWVEDPTNSEVDYFRNWIRNDWLPALENKRPGSCKNFAKSFTKLSELLGESDAYKLGEDEFLSRMDFNLLTPIEKKMAIFAYVKGIGCSSYTENQILEIVKRLDTSQKQLRFKVLGLDWQINAEHIKAQPIV